MTRGEVLQLGEGQRRRGRDRLGWLLPVAAVFMAVGAWAVSSGKPIGWTVVLFFGAFVPMAPAMVGQSTQLPRFQTTPFEARRRGTASAGRVLGLAMMTAGALSAFLWGAADVRGVIVGLLGLGMVPPLVVATLRAFEPGPVIVVDGQGYFDRRVMRRPTPWSEVTGLRMREIRGTRSFALTRADPSSNRRPFAWINGALGGVVPLVHVDLDCTLTDLFLAIQAHRPDLFEDLARQIGG